MIVSCDHLSPFFDGELEDSESAAFREHLCGCTGCRQRLQICMQLEMLGDPQAQAERDAAVGGILVRPHVADTRVSRVEVRKIEDAEAMQPRHPRRPRVTASLPHEEPQLASLPFKVISVLEHRDARSVFRARDRVGREVALTIVSAAFMHDDTALDNLMRHVVLASRLDHPNLMRTFELGLCSDDRLFVVTEYVPGRTLAEAIEREGPLAPSRVIRIGVQICAALASAHAAGIIHRDVKPAHVKLAPDDAVKVIGLEAVASLGCPQARGRIIGTVTYMAPEGFADAAVDCRADLYALGCTLYEAASGRPPFAGLPLMAVIAMHMYARPPRLVGIPQRLMTVIERLLAKDPADRYPTATAAREALEAAARDLDPA